MSYNLVFAGNFIKMPFFVEGCLQKKYIENTVWNTDWNSDGHNGLQLINLQDALPSPNGIWSLGLKIGVVFFSLSQGSSSAYNLQTCTGLILHTENGASRDMEPPSFLWSAAVAKKSP